MASPAFKSAYQRLAWAQEHIAELEGELRAYFDRKPYAHVIDVDADGVTQLHKIRFSELPPDTCVHLVTHTLEDLRSALDQAGYASAILAGKINPKNTYFPVGDTLDKIKTDIIGRRRCDDLPPQILDIFLRFQPYQGGNDLLWALNKLRNAIHTALIPIPPAAAGLAMKDHPVFSGGAFQLIPIPLWDGDKNEFVFARTNVTMEFEYYGRMYFEVAFDDPEPIRGKNVFGVLREMARVVECVLVATEAECRRIGFDP